MRDGFDDDYDEEEIKMDGAGGRPTNGGYEKGADDSNIFGTSHINHESRKYNQDDSYIPEIDKSQIFNQVVMLDKDMLKSITSNKNK